MTTTLEVHSNLVSYSFKHARRYGVWLVYEHEGRSMRLLGAGRLLSKSAARAHAQAHALAKGIAYAEWQKPPPPTPEDERRAKFAECCAKVAFFDSNAAHYTSNADKDSLGEAHAHQKAAECWQRAAEWCMRAAEFEMHRREHYAICAQSRLKNARRSLVRWVWALGDAPPRRWLRTLDGGRETTEPVLGRLSVVPVSPAE